MSGSSAWVLWMQWCAWAEGCYTEKKVRQVCREVHERSQWTPACIGRKSLISVVRREHTFEIEELLKRVWVLRIAGVLTRFEHHRIIGARVVSHVKGPRWKTRQHIVSAPGNTKLDRWNGAHVEFVTPKQLTLIRPCAGCVPRTTQRHVVQGASAERSNMRPESVT